MYEGIIKSLKCVHEVNKVLLDHNSVYHDNNNNIHLKTKVIKMVCIKCKELITKEYIIDFKNESTK